MTKKRSKSILERMQDAFKKALRSKKVSRRTRSSLASVAGIASITLTILVFSKAHRETTTLLDQTKIRTQAIQALLDSQNFGYAIMDQDGKIVEWNPAMERLTHYTEQEVKKNGLEGMMSPELFEKHKKAIAKIMASDHLIGKVAVVDCVILPHGKDTESIPVKVTVRTVQDRKGHRFAIAHIDEKSNIKGVTMQ